MALGVEERYRSLERRIVQAAARAGRDRQTVRLLGAAKRQPLARLEEAYAAGLRLFAENQVQEAYEHASSLPRDVEWHLIGPLQSNKARRAVKLFSVIHSIDRQKIAHVLERVAGEENKTIDGFLEVNLEGEASKHGFSPEELGSLDEVAALEHLRVVGLMSIPPPTPTAEEARPHFQFLRQLRDDLFSRPAWSSRPGYLSMGMSGDFEIAIEEGATHVRIGSSLFGQRPG